MTPTPDLVQVGNEIMYGLCGIKVHPYEEAGDNWDGYLGLLKAGCNAVREECPNAQIIIHTDRPTDSGYNSFYYNKLIKGGVDFDIIRLSYYPFWHKLIKGGVDFDIIGLSYYPFWHGYLTAEQVADKKDKNNLVNAVKNLKTLFPNKRVHIVECAYNFQYWPTSGVNYDTRDAWPCSIAGQYAFVKDLVDALKPLSNVDGRPATAMTPTGPPAKERLSPPGSTADSGMRVKAPAVMPSIRPETSVQERPPQTYVHPITWVRSSRALRTSKR